MVNVRTAAQHYATNVVKRIVFDRRHFGEPTSNGGPSFEDEQHIEALFTMLLYNYAFNISDYLPMLKWLDIDGHSKKVLDSVEIVKNIHDPIVNDRIRQWRDGTQTDPVDLLDVFVSLTDSKGYPLLSEDEVKAQIMVRKESFILFNVFYITLLISICNVPSN